MKWRDGKYYKATVARYDADTEEHKIAYVEDLERLNDHLREPEIVDAELSNLTGKLVCADLLNTPAERAENNSVLLELIRSSRTSGSVNEMNS